MPAVLGHWVVAEQTALDFIINERKGSEYFRGKGGEQHRGISQYFYLGSNGPDLPYFHDADLGGKIKDLVGKDIVGKSKYADLYHYNKQGEFIIQLLKLIRDDAGDGELNSRVMAYALGHIAHIATDTILHPYVNSFAGIYHEQTQENIHKISECHQDSYLAQKYFSREKIDTGYSWTRFISAFLGGGSGGIVTTSEEVEKVITIIVSAFSNTYGEENAMEAEYLRDSLENFYDTGLDIGYDTATGPIPKDYCEKLVQHEKDSNNYLEHYILKLAPALCARLCEKAIGFYNNEIGEDELRGELKNFNMDTGYWLDVDMEDGLIAINFKHSWCHFLNTDFQPIRIKSAKIVKEDGGETLSVSTEGLNDNTTLYVKFADEDLIEETDDELYENTDGGKKNIWKMNISNNKGSLGIPDILEGGWEMFEGNYELYAKIYLFDDATGRYDYTFKTRTLKKTE